MKTSPIIKNGVLLLLTITVIAFCTISAGCIQVNVTNVEIGNISYTAAGSPADMTKNDDPALSNVTSPSNGTPVSDPPATKITPVETQAQESPYSGTFSLGAGLYSAPSSGTVPTVTPTGAVPSGMMNGTRPSGTPPSGLPPSGSLPSGQMNGTRPSTTPASSSSSWSRFISSLK
jgi:hypothetical protein